MPEVSLDSGMPEIPQFANSSPNGFSFFKADPVKIPDIE
jgi:hypothetical protein